MNIRRPKMRFRWVIALSVCFLSFAGVGVAATNDACELPQGLDRKVANKYPDAHIISVADLYPQDKQLYEKDHRAQCPGLVSVDFYGDENPHGLWCWFRARTRHT
jgi:hypothetical protein